MCSINVLIKLTKTFGNVNVKENKENIIRSYRYYLMQESYLYYIICLIFVLF